MSGANNEPIVLSVPLTHSDWMGRIDMPLDESSVRYMLDQCKASGWSKVYWRLFNGGHTVYHSELADPAGPWDKDNYWDPQNPDDLKYVYWKDDPKINRQKILAGISRWNYAALDTLAEAVSYGHSIGLEILAWLSINEDDHAWGLQSRFTKAHPRSRWVKRDGTVYHSQQSFAFPEVREYKLALIRELLENYEIDGLLLDWIRTGDTRDDPQNDAHGVADFGYEAPLVESFTAHYGIDPHTLPNGDERWVAWRAFPQTEFMRQARRLIKSLKPDLPLTVMGQHPWSYRGTYHKIDGNLRGLLLDFETWAREGLMDSAVAAGYYRDGGTPKQAYEWLKTETRGLVDIWYYGWVPSTPDYFATDLAHARELGAKQILLWEADYIDDRKNKGQLQECMREAAGMNAPIPA